MGDNTDYWNTARRASASKLGDWLGLGLSVGQQEVEEPPLPKKKRGRAAANNQEDDVASVAASQLDSTWNDSWT
jgi:hypothetical protein